jgi:hypothetical protein
VSYDFVTAAQYEFFLSAITGGAAVYWIGIDSYRLRKALADDRTDAGVRDRIFGSMVGIVVGVVGVVGVALHHLR